MGNCCGGNKIEQLHRRSDRLPIDMALSGLPEFCTVTSQQGSK